MSLGGIGFFVLLIQAAVFGVFCGLMYWLTKTAVRDGIKESGLIEELRRSRPGRTEPKGLPDWGK